MKKLDCLTKESIKILHKNRLFQPLIKAEYLKEVLSNVVIENDLIETNIKTFKSRLGIDSDDKFDKWLTTHELDLEEFKYIASQNELIKSFAKEKFDRQVEARFLERKSDLDIIVYTLIRVSRPTLANELYLRAKGNEEDMGTLASLYSEGIERKTRGIVGPVPISSANPKLANHLKKSTLGEVKMPIIIDKIFLITRLEVLEAATLDDFMRVKMREELFNKWLDREVEIQTDNFLARDKEISTIEKS